MKKMLLGIAMLLFIIVLAILDVRTETCIAAGLFALVLTVFERSEYCRWIGKAKWKSVIVY